MTLWKKLVHRWLLLLQLLHVCTQALEDHAFLDKVSTLISQCDFLAEHPEQSFWIHDYFVSDAAGNAVLLANSINITFPWDIFEKHFTDIAWDVGSILSDVHNFQGMTEDAQGSGAGLDIGCNIGLQSILAAKLFPKMRIACFEPVPDTFASLVRMLEANGLADRVMVKPLAVGGKSEQSPAHIYVDPSDKGVNRNLGASSMWSKRDSLIGGDRIEIRMTSFIEAVESALALSPEQHLSFIKFDCEGCEYLVFSQEKFETSYEVLFHKLRGPLVGDLHPGMGFAESEFAELFTARIMCVKVGRGQASALTFEDLNHGMTECLDEYFPDDDFASTQKKPGWMLAHQKITDFHQAHRQNEKLEEL